MIKAIKTQTGIHNLSVEEVLLSFDNMFKKFAHSCVNGLKKVDGNVDEFEDYVQLAKIEAISAFKTYDIDKDIMFSTYLSNSLRYVFIHLLRDSNAQKRKNEKPLLYINKETESGEDGTGVLANPKEDVYFSDDANTLENFIKENLTADEIVFLTMGLKKQVGKAKGVQKSSLIYAIDAFVDSKYINHQNGISKTKAELAEQIGISRPTLNKRINETMIKTKQLAEKYIQER